MECQNCQQEFYETVTNNLCPFCNTSHNVPPSPTTESNSDNGFYVTNVADQFDILEVLNKQFNPNNISNEPIACQVCNYKNLSIYEYCTMCHSPLYSRQLKRRSEIDNLRQFKSLMSDKKWEGFYYKGLHTMIIHYLIVNTNGKTNFFVPMKCGEQHQTNCPEMLTSQDYKCPSCGKLHLVFPCIQCQKPISLEKHNCPHCGTDSITTYFDLAIKGEIEGKITEQIYNYLEELFHLKVKKHTKPISINQNNILQIKQQLETIINDVEQIARLWGEHLSDLVAKGDRKKLLYKTSQQAIQQDWPNVGAQGFDIPSLSGTQELNEILADHGGQPQGGVSQDAFPEDDEDDEDLEDAFQNQF